VIGWYVAQRNSIRCRRSDANSMYTPPPKDPDAESDAGLLADHKYFADSIWKNEDVGEKRLNVFITLVTAAITALVALHAKDNALSPDASFWVTSYALFGLLLFGCVMLMRMKRRQQAGQELRDALDSVRVQLKKLRKLPQDYDPFAKARRVRHLTGGLGETVAVINTIILVAFISFVHWQEHWPVTARFIGSYVLFSILFLVLQVKYFHRPPKEKTPAKAAVKL